MQKMLKVANKHARVIYDVCSKLSIGTQKQRHIFSLSTTFNNSHGILIQLREFCLFQYTLYFVSNTFISNARLKLAENWVKAKTRPEAELLLFENYSLSSSTYHQKMIEGILKNVQKTSASVLMTLYDHWQWKWGWELKVDHKDTT